MSRRLGHYLSLFMLLLLPVRALAIDPAIAHNIRYDAVFSDDAATATGCNPSTPAGTLPAIIPEPYNGAFTAGANKFNVAPALIAALFTEENFTGTDPAQLAKRWTDFTKSHPDPNAGWPTNQFQTMGAFQFIPPTWAAEGVDMNGDGKKDAMNIADAAGGAANYVASNGATKDKAPATWQQAIFSYNHAQWYVDAVMKYYNFYNSGTAATASSAPASASPTPGGSACGGGTGISADGFVFPQRTTKAQLAAQKPSVWSPDCVNKVSIMGPGSSNPVMDISGLCHHDYLAADIFNDTGTAVVAPRPGRIVSSGDGGSVGWTVRISSEKALGGDGLWYYFAHMLKPAEHGTVYPKVGDVVKAGDQIGSVGNDADAQNTQHHTHFDVSPVDNSFDRGYNGTSGPLMDPMPALKAAYAKLPSN